MSYYEINHDEVSMKHRNQLLFLFKVSFDYRPCSICNLYASKVHRKTWLYTMMQICCRHWTMYFCILIVRLAELPAITRTISVCSSLHYDCFHTSDYSLLTVKGKGRKFWEDINILNHSSQNSSIFEKYPERTEK